MTDPPALEAGIGAASSVLAEEVGLRLNGAMAGRLTRCVVEEAHAHHVALGDYAGRLKSSPALLQGLIDRVTVQESSFFRDPSQLDAFRDHVLPTWAHSGTGGADGAGGGYGPAGTYQIWSAGCSNGQEPYTLAILLAEAGVSHWHVTATDVSRRALERTKRARYTGRELGGLSPERRTRFLAAIGTEWEVVPSLRSRVEVARHNLVTEAPPFPAGGCHAIFCRNVLIYLRPEVVIGLLERMAACLHPGGWLFVGYAESLWRLTDVFQLVRIGGGFAYRLAERAQAPETPAAGVPGVGTLVGRRPAVGTRPAAAAGARASLPFGRDWGARSLRGIRGQGGGGAGRGAGGHGGAHLGGGGAGGGAGGRARQADMAAAPRAEVAQLLAEGEVAMNAADFPSAVTVFRRCVYLAPDDPVVHLHLALALEAAGDSPSARRAYAVARRTLDQASSNSIEATLEGYQIGELARLLDAKLAPPRREA